MTLIARVAVKSSSISSVGYWKEGLVLEIEFVTGAVYEYQKVPAECFEEFVRAPSCGRFFNQAIRDRYPHRRLGGPEVRQ